jgi:hypothetical protein
MTGKPLDDRVSDLEKSQTRTETLLEEHVKSCDKRNELILKLVMWALLILVLLAVESTFNLHLPSAPVI